MPKSKTDQLARFKEAARDLGADDDEDRFNERLRRLAKQKHEDEKKSED